MDVNELKEVAVTRKKFVEVWNNLPEQCRFREEISIKAKDGFTCFRLGNLLIYEDYLLSQIEDEIDCLSESVAKTGLNPLQDEHSFNGN